MKTSALPRLGLKNLGLGVGLRKKHFNHLLSNPPVADWLEIISENYIDDYGHARSVLLRLRRDVPVVMHGVSMSIGSTDPLNRDYLKKLKELAAVVEPEWISDHLCWTGAAFTNTHDLLPIPLNEETLNRVSDRVEQIQDFLRRPLVIENPSTYLEFRASTMREWEFLSALATRTGCGLLLDINNVFISSHNYGYDAENYIRSLPYNQIVQVHIESPSDCSSLLADMHDHPAPSEDVWRLYRLAQTLTGGVSTLLEWHDRVPEYPELVEELFKTRKAMTGSYPMHLQLEEAYS